MQVCLFALVWDALEPAGAALSWSPGCVCCGSTGVHTSAELPSRFCPARVSPLTTCPRPFDTLCPPPPTWFQDGEGEVDPNRPVIKPLHQQSLFGV